MGKWEDRLIYSCLHPPISVVYMSKFWRKVQSIPPHWKILFTCQLVITTGLIGYRQHQLTQFKQKRRNMDIPVEKRNQN